jgi:hypothetical protein
MTKAFSHNSVILYLFEWENNLDIIYTPKEVEQQDRVYECEGKIRFDDIKRAMKTAKLSRQRRNSHANAYYCKFCRGYHIGNSLIPKELKHNIDKSKKP